MSGMPDGRPCKPDNLQYLVQSDSGEEANRLRLYRLLQANDFEGMRALFHAFFAIIPHEWYTNACPRMGESGNDIARYEGYYASVFYAYCATLELDITVEDSTSHGRLDMEVQFDGTVYLFEFMVVEMADEGAAMAQLKERRYADKYRGAGAPVHLVAVEFSRDTRNVVAFEGARLNGDGDPRFVLSRGEEAIDSLTDPSTLVTHTRLVPARLVWKHEIESAFAAHRILDVAQRELLSLYWYVSFEYLGSHEVGTRQMGQDGEVVIVR